MNGLAGRLMMKAERQVVELVETSDGQEIELRKKESLDYESLVEHDLSPCRLACVMLSYTRDHMFTYFNLLGRENVIGTETDSLVTFAELGKTLLEDGGKCGKNFGQLTPEWDSVTEAIIVEKKIWYQDVVKDGKPGTKMTWKRVPQAHRQMYLDFYNGKDVTVSTQIFTRLNHDIRTNGCVCAVAIGDKSVFSMKRKFRYDCGKNLRHSDFDCNTCHKCVFLNQIE
jgi:hypothetical protein